LTFITIIIPQNLGIDKIVKMCYTCLLFHDKILKNRNISLIHLILAKNCMFYATWRESKRLPAVLGLIFAFSLIFSIFAVAGTASASTWLGTTQSEAEAISANSLVTYGNYVALLSNGSGVYLYEKSGTNFNPVAVLTPSDGDSNFGGFLNGVAMDENTVVVGTRSNSNKAYVFRKNGSWSDSTETAILSLPAEGASTFSAYNVGVGGDTVVVSDHGRGNGLVYVYTAPGGVWESTSTATAILDPASTGYSGNYSLFGYTLAMSADNIVIRLKARELNHKVLVYNRPATGWTDVGAPVLLTESAGYSNNSFGSSLDISDDGNTIAIGDSYLGKVFVYEGSSGNWADTTETAVLQPSDPNHGNRFGASVSVSGSHIMIGSPYSNHDFVCANSSRCGGQWNPGYEYGAAYIFEKSGVWSNTTETTRVFGQVSDLNHFGQNVGQINGELVVLSDNDNSFYSFTPSVYENATPVLNFVTQPVQSTDNSGYVNASILVSNPNTDLMDLTFEYSANNGLNWHIAKLKNVVFDPSTDSAVNLSAGTITNLPSGTTVSFAFDTRGTRAGLDWDSEAVLLDALTNGAIKLRIKAQTDLAIGDSLVSGDININNTTLVPPTQLTFGEITTNSIQFFWDEVFGATNYNILVNSSGTPYNTETVIYQLNDLSPDTLYNIQISSNDGTNTSAYSDIFSTSTLAMAVDTATTTEEDGDDSDGNDNGSGNGCGNCGGGSSVVVPTIITSAIIEQGPISTTTIHINSDVTNATEMMVSENNNFTGASWVNYTTSTAFTLSDGNGQKTVYVKYRSSSGGVTEPRALTIVLANLGGQGNPGDNGNGNGNNSTSTNNNSGNTPVSNNTPISVTQPVAVVAVSGIKITDPSILTNTNPLEIQLATTSDNNGLVPTAQAGENIGFGSKDSGYFARVFNSENNWVIALSALIAVVIISGGWFAYKRQKDGKIAENPVVSEQKEEKNDSNK